jgi:PTH1 family peptidyl-tRNA hydrolase
MDQTLIIGLGNPDPALEETYHNAGALAVRWIVNHADVDGPGMSAPKFRAYKDIFSYVKIGKYIFIRPLVFMNESGRAVKEAMRVFEAGAGDIAIIHDDSDLLIGEVKYSTGGRSAGHKGIQSIIDHLKTDNFLRIRIGIREKNEVNRKKAEDFVLSPISTKDREILETAFATIALSQSRR